MITLELTVNGRPVSECVEPRMHLADFLRDRLTLTATHTRCEQGVCGACTLLIDGQPARSCITYAVLCQGAQVTTIEGLLDDAIMVSLRRAFAEEHGLQCGFCTPGMLVTARDIVLRLPDADGAQVRKELSGNLCRCTGYVGIVQAICRVLREWRGETRPAANGPLSLAPVGSRPSLQVLSAGLSPAAAPAIAAFFAPDTELGLQSRQPNIQMHQTFKVARPIEETWAFLGQIEEVARCLPGAELTRPPADNAVEGAFSAKLGPITAKFAGNARITRDDAARRGLILGSGRDRLTGSRASGEIEYQLHPGEEVTETRVEVTIRALLAGPLAQFGRSAIVDEVAARIIRMFAHNMEARLAGSTKLAPPKALRIGSLVLPAVWSGAQRAWGRLRQTLYR